MVLSKWIPGNRLTKNMKTLEMIIQCKSLGSAISTICSFRILGTLQIGLLLIWAASPLGGRVLYESPTLYLFLRHLSPFHGLCWTTQTHLLWVGHMYSKIKPGMFRLYHLPCNTQANQPFTLAIVSNATRIKSRLSFLYHHISCTNLWLSGLS